MVAQFAVCSLRKFRIDELLPFLEGQLFLVFGQDAEGVLRLVFQEIYFPFLALIGFLSFLLFSVFYGDEVDALSNFLGVKVMSRMLNGLRNAS